LFASKIAVTCAFNIDTDEERERERERERESERGLRMTYNSIMIKACLSLFFTALIIIIIIIIILFKRFLQKTCIIIVFS
jgi:thiol:disulfide interchange protein